MKKQHIGCRVASEVKEALRENAENAGLTLTEYLEEVFDDHLNGDGTDLLEFLEEDEEEADFEDLPPGESISDLGGLSAFLPELMARELGCSITEAWEEAQEKAPDSTDPLSVLFLELLADRLDDGATGGARYCEDGANYDYYLPEELTEQVDAVLIDSLNELGQHPSRTDLFQLIADLLRDKANGIYEHERTIELSFTRNQWIQLDKAIAKLNKDADFDFKASTVKELIHQFLGDTLTKLAGTSFFSGKPKDPDMYGVGEELKGMYG